MPTLREILYRLRARRATKKALKYSQNCFLCCSPADPEAFADRELQKVFAIYCRRVVGQVRK